MLDKYLFLSKEIMYVDKHNVIPVYKNHHYIAFKCPPVQLNEE